MFRRGNAVPGNVGFRGGNRRFGEGWIGLELLQEAFRVAAENRFFRGDGEFGIDDPAELLAGIAHRLVGAEKDAGGAAAVYEVFDHAAGDGAVVGFGEEVRETAAKLDDGVGGFVAVTGVVGDDFEIWVAGADGDEFVGLIPVIRMDTDVEAAGFGVLPKGGKFGAVVGNAEGGIGFEAEDGAVAAELFEFGDFLGVGFSGDVDGGEAPETFGMFIDGGDDGTVAFVLFRALDAAPGHDAEAVDSDAVGVFEQTGGVAFQHDLGAAAAMAVFDDVGMEIDDGATERFSGGGVGDEFVGGRIGRERGSGLEAENATEVFSSDGGADFGVGVGPVDVGFRGAEGSGGSGGGEEEAVGGAFFDEEFQAAVGVVVFEGEVDLRVVEEEGGDFALAFPVSVEGDPVEVGNRGNQFLEIGGGIFGVERNEDRPAAFREEMEEVAAAFAAGIPGVGFGKNLDGGDAVGDEFVGEASGGGEISGVAGEDGPERGEGVGELLAEREVGLENVDGDLIALGNECLLHAAVTHLPEEIGCGVRQARVHFEGSSDGGPGVEIGRGTHAECFAGGRPERTGKSDDGNAFSSMGRL